MSNCRPAALNTGGNRLPAYCSSLGRVLLAHLAPDALDAYFAQVKLKACTDCTVVSASRIRELLEKVRRDGYALVDEELETGLRAIAVPVRDASGQVIAALNVGVPTGRVPIRLMIGEFLPVLLQGAQDMTALLPQARHRASQA